MEGGDWTWRMTKEEEDAVESDVEDRSSRLSSAHRRAFMLSSLPSTATTTQPKLLFIFVFLLDYCSSLRKKKDADEVKLCDCDEGG